MTVLPQYIVAKYAPDLNRMEPRNIGVIVWADGHSATRFMKVEDASFVDDHRLFGRWVRFWTDQAEEASIRVGGREPVSCDDPRFVDELCRTQKGHYLLYKAGRVHEKLAPAELADVAEFLFDELVSTKKRSATAKPMDRFATACDELLAEAGLTQRTDWQGEKQVEFVVGEIRQEYQFNYVVGNGLPTAIGHRVPLNRPHSVNNAAFLFEWIEKSKVVRHKNNRFALVEIESSQVAETRARLLNEFATVVNVVDRPAALKALRRVDPTRT